MNTLILVLLPSMAAFVVAVLALVFQATIDRRELRYAQRRGCLGLYYSWRQYRRERVVSLAGTLTLVLGAVVVLLLLRFAVLAGVL